MDYTKQFLYGIKILNFIKIGISNNPLTRLQAVNTCSPFEAELIFYAQHPKEKAHHLEAKMHSELSKQGRHERLEWFKYAGDEIEVLYSILGGEAKSLQVQSAYGSDYEKQAMDALEIVAKSYREAC